jgi:hypothetical protein
MNAKLATCSILTSDLNKLDADRRAARLESMKASVAKAAKRQLDGRPPWEWDEAVETVIESSGPVTTAVVRYINPWK